MIGCCVKRVCTELRSARYYGQRQTTARNDVVLFDMLVICISFTLLPTYLCLSNSRHYALLKDMSLAFSPALLRIATKLEQARLPTSYLS